MAEAVRVPGNGSSMEVWQPVTDALSALRTAGVTPADYSDPLRRSLALRGTTASQQARGHLKGFKPTINLKFRIDGSGSMSDDTGPVQNDLPIFLNETIVQSLGTIPDQVQQQISPQRRVIWDRVDFGDGSQESGWRQDRIDNPYLSVTRGEVEFDAQDLCAGAERITSQFRAFHPHYGGGGNTGESSAEAATLMDLNPQNQGQLALLNRLLHDCKSLSAAKRGGTLDTDTIVPYLTDLIAGKFIPPLLQGVQTQGNEGYDMIFLVTDEPAIEHLIKLQELADLKMKHGLFAIITPKSGYNCRDLEGYWREQAEKLGGQWFDLNNLTHARATVNGMNLAQQRMAQAIQAQVAKTVARDLKSVLRLTDGGKPGSSNPGAIIIR